MKRFLLPAAIVLFCWSVLILGGLWAVKRGISPLVAGESLQGGQVTVVVDDTSPMPVAAYLLRFKDNSLGLIDATMDPNAEAIRKAIHGMGASDSDLKFILFTHTHGDHTAGAQAFPQATLYAMRPAPTDPPGSNSTSPSLPRIRRIPREAHQEVGLPHKATRLEDGEILEFQDSRIEAFAVPGHTSDSCAYLACGVLFLGDSAAGQYNGRIGSAPPFVSKDRQQNQRELKKLAQRLLSRKHEVALLAFGHQGPLKGLDPLLNWAAAN